MVTYLSQIYNYLKYDENFISWARYISLEDFYYSYCAHKIYGLGNQRYPWYLPIKLVICWLNVKTVYDDKISQLDCCWIVISPDIEYPVWN